MSLEIVQKNFKEAHSVLEKFMSIPENLSKISDAGELMARQIINGGKVISCGNGGSMSDAMHFAEELTGRYRDNRRSLPAIAISDPGFITCAGNDFGYEYIFSRFLEGMGRNNDVLLAISTSGNSKNVVNAAKVAREKRMVVIGLTGKDGGELAGYCDIEIRAPHSEYADRVQEIHIKVIHTFIGIIESIMVG